MKSRLLMLISLFVSVSVFAGDSGSAGAASKEAYTLDEMLEYAIEDEHLALAEYQAIMETFGVQRPYSNIAESEKTHIGYLETLYKDLRKPIPETDFDIPVTFPKTLSEAASIGVNAEIANIAMYEKFLKEDLPANVREVFVLLKNASENHLKAFERQLETGGRGTGPNRLGK